LIIVAILRIQKLELATGHVIFLAASAGKLTTHILSYRRRKIASWAGWG
jgi:hypothetical protein